MEILDRLIDQDPCKGEKTGQYMLPGGFRWLNEHG